MVEGEGVWAAGVKSIKNILSLLRASEHYQTTGLPILFTLYSLNHHSGNSKPFAHTPSPSEAILST